MLMLELGEKIKQYRRVIHIARKPSKEEFASSGKICAAGMGVIGVVGFAVLVIFMVLGL